MDESTMKGCWTRPLIPGAHKAAVLARFRALSFASHAEPPPPVSCSPIEGTPNRTIDPVYDTIIDDRESVVVSFSSPTEARPDRISLVNRPISYSINQRNVTREFAQYFAFSPAAQPLAVIIGILNKKKKRRVRG